MKFIRLKIGILLISFCFTVGTVSAKEPFVENAHYKRVSSGFELAPDPSKKIEVLEFFLYSCSHCYELEPKLNTWVKENKDKVVFKKLPAVLTPTWIPLAKAYYVAEKLGVLDKTHDALFKSIHIDKKIYLNEYTLSEFFAGHGVKPEDFMREFNAKDIIDKVSEARILSAKYAFRGVPAVVINDEFKTAPFYVKNQQQMLKVMDYLLETIKRR